MAAVFARVNLLLASLLIFSCVPFSTAASIDPRKRVLRCALPDSRAVAALQTLASNSPEIDVWRVGKSDFDASVGSKAARVLETAFSCSVFIDDVTALLDEEVAASRVYSLLPSLNEPSNAQRVISRPAFDHDRYLDYPSIQALLSSYAAANPSLAEFLPSIGLPTWEGRNISCIKIRKSADSVRKQVLFTGGIHAREWIAPATVLYITDHLLQSARDAEIAIKRGSKPDDLAARVSALLASGVEWILCPSINPDGYSYSHSPSGQRLWRKNRRSNGLGSYGVDLNRNFPIHWGETGGSSLPFSEIYQGPSASSEPETQSLLALARSLPNLTASIDFHSYGQLILRSWGFSDSPSRNEPILKKLGDGMSRFLHGFISERSSELYTTSGSFDDYLSAKMGIAGFTVELPDKGGKGFVLPPERIRGVGAEALEAAVFFTEFVTEREIPRNGE